MRTTVAEVLGNSMMSYEEPARLQTGMSNHKNPSVRCSRLGSSASPRRLTPLASLIQRSSSPPPSSVSTPARWGRSRGRRSPSLAPGPDGRGTHPGPWWRPAGTLTIRPRSRGACPRSAAGSEPAPPLEDDVQHDPHRHHRHNRQRVTQPPGELRHVVKVHAIDGADQSGGEEDSRP